MARAYADLHETRKELRSRGADLSPRAVELYRIRAKERAVEDWLTKLRNPRAGIQVIEEIRPLLADWVDRPHGNLSFRVVQVLSGHGCFGEHLHHRAGKESSLKCHHCGEPEDTAQHTLELCPEWAEKRRVLQEVIGADLSLQSVIRGMLDSEEKWAAVASFCEDVLTRKEVAERERDGPGCRGMQKEESGSS